MLVFLGDCMKVVVLRRRKRSLANGAMNVEPLNGGVDEAAEPWRHHAATLAKVLRLPVPGEVARELLSHPDMIDPLHDSIAKLNSLLPSLGLEEAMRLEAAQYPDFPKVRLRIAVRARSPLTPERWMSTWDELSQAIEGSMRTGELGKRVFVYLDPCW